MTNDNLKLFDKIYIFVLFFSANILISPLLYLSFSGIRLWMPIILVLFSALLILLLLNNILNLCIKQSIIFIFLFFIMCQFIYGIYCQSISAINYNSGLILGIFLLIFVKDIDRKDSKHMDIFIKWSTIFLLILIVGAYIGFLYHFTGGRVLLSFNNPDGRANRLYLTTLSNSVYFGFLRPAGIYDEPGAFSFFICSLSLLRILYNKNNRVTFLLLVSGIITFSLTHFLIIICYLLYLAINYYRKRTFILLLALTSIGIVIVYLLLKDALDAVLLRRVSSVDFLFNNNRSRQIPNVIDNLDLPTFFFGLIADHNYNFLKMTEYIGGDVSSNPLTPIIATGVIASLIYYIFLLSVLISALLKKKLFFIYLAIFILFIQRPYFSARGYCVYFILFFIISIQYIFQNIPRTIFKIKKYE